MTRMTSSGGRRLVRGVIALLVLGGLLPFGVVAGAQEERADFPGTPVTVTFTTVEVLDPGHEWAGADGTFHVRDQIEVNSVSGDINGTAMITISGDFVITGECTDEFCEGEFLGWVKADVETDSGGWTGDLGFVAVGESGYSEFRGMLVGNGANAGSLIYIDTFVDETDAAITLSGYRVERGARPEGMRLRYDGCFAGFDGNGGTVGGGFIMSSPRDDAGALDASFTAIGLQTPAVVFGDMTFTGSHGTLTGVFVEAEAAGGADFGVGTFIMTGGTGAYEGLYGYGRVIERAVFEQSGTCDGPKGYWIGETFAR